MKKKIKEVDYLTYKYLGDIIIEVRRKPLL